MKSTTVTVQLMSGPVSPSPASNQIVLACSQTAKIAPLSQPAAAYSWSAFVTASSGTFGCGGTALRGTSVTCSNGSAGSTVTILAT